MPKTAYGFAIVGCGAIGRFHAEQLLHVERARLVAVCSGSEDKAKQFASEFGCAAYTDLENLLRDDEVDIVNICTPSGMHGVQTITCARKGKHVIVEKPMDITLAGADSVIEACREAGVKLCVVSQHRFDPATQQVKRLLEQGAFGKVVMANGAVNWYRSGEYYENSLWRGTWRGDGGGALMNQGIHVVDVLQYLMGPVDSVHAHCATLGHPGIEVEDCAVATLKFRNGAIGTLTATTSAYPGLHTRVEIFGTNGSAVIENDALVFCTIKSINNQDRNLAEFAEKPVKGKGSRDPMSISGEAHRMQFADMIRALDENREPLVNGVEGRKPLEIVLAVYESSKTGKTVFLY